jgi:transcriptional regulator with XRE-family HTH domain
MATFAKSMKALMKTLKVSQQDVATRIGISQGMVSRWVRSENVPDVYQAQQVAEALGVPLDLMFATQAEHMTRDDIRRIRMVIEMTRELGLDESITRLMAIRRGPPVDVSVDASPVHSVVPAQSVEDFRSERIDRRKGKKGQAGPVS